MLLQEVSSPGVYWTLLPGCVATWRCLITYELALTLVLPSMKECTFWNLTSEAASFQDLKHWGSRPQSLELVR